MATMPFLTLANTFTDELAFQEGGINWGTDWWKLIIIAFCALLLVFLTIRLALYILRIVGVILCIVFAGAGAFLAWKLVPEHISGLLPESVAPYAPALAAFIAFIVCFALSAGVMMLIRKPAQPLPDGDDKK